MTNKIMSYVSNHDYHNPKITRSFSVKTFTSELVYESEFAFDPFKFDGAHRAGVAKNMWLGLNCFKM